MTFESIIKSNLFTCYVLELNPKQMAKLGYTNKPIDKRIASFKFGKGYKSIQRDVKVCYKHTRHDAQSIETVAKLLADNLYERVMDKNMCSGYTEWYYATPTQLNMCVLNAIRFLNWKPKRIMKSTPSEKMVQMDLFS